MRTTAPLNQAGRQFHSKRQLGFGDGQRFLQPMRFLQITICLPGRNGTVLCQMLDGIGQSVELAQQSAGTIETLGFLGIARAPHMS